jgi:RND superfamily putative drug exporter
MLFCRCLALGLVRGIAVFLVAVLLRSGLGVTADGPVPGGRTLSGRANWWLPGWLDRTLPHLSIEPAIQPPASPTPAPASEVAHGQAAR